jgi:hypothetical protein
MVQYYPNQLMVQYCQNQLMVNVQTSWSSRLSKIMNLLATPDTQHWPKQTVPSLVAKEKKCLTRYKLLFLWRDKVLAKFRQNGKSMQKRESLIRPHLLYIRQFYGNIFILS